MGVGEREGGDRAHCDVEQSNFPARKKFYFALCSHYKTEFHFKKT